MGVSGCVHKGFWAISPVVRCSIVCLEHTVRRLPIVIWKKSQVNSVLTFCFATVVFIHCYLHHFKHLFESRSCTLVTMTRNALPFLSFLPPLSCMFWFLLILCHFFFLLSQNDAQQALDICRQVFRSDPHNDTCLPVYLAAMVGFNGSGISSQGNGKKGHEHAITFSRLTLAVVALQ